MSTQSCGKLIHATVVLECGTYLHNLFKMVRTRNEKITTKARRLKKGRDDDHESDVESIGSEDTTDTEEESDSDYKPPKKKTNKKSRKVIEDDEEDDTETEYTDIDEDDEDVDEEEEEAIRKKVRKIASKIFPSNYIKNKVKQDKKQKPEDKKKKKKPVVYEEEEDDEDDEDCDEDDYDEEDEEEEDNKINIIFGFGGGGDEDEDELEDDEDEECNSDDEKMFMKETYETVDVPEVDRKAKEKKDKKLKKEQEKQDKEKIAFDSEYADLVETKKFFTEKLKKKPDSKSLLKSLTDCKDAIKQLVKKTRSDNTKDYHKLVNAPKQKAESEMEYFKKKLSNKEQRKIMKDLEEINTHIMIDRPYRLALLQSKIPTKYKATVMQKLNLLKSMDTCDSEYFKLKNWVDQFMRIPFGKYAILDVNMAHGLDACQGFMDNSMKILNECAYGLVDAKMQILQMIGQWIANPSAMGTAIALKGPMGTGKTTLAKYGISKILNRSFSLVPLGGATDEAVFVGSPYVYEGSGPGIITKILSATQEMNPCILFDELDKVGEGEKGREIIGILTHMTDSTQNDQFHDKYFPDVDFDISRTVLLFSYNDESMVNPILKDRMYSIQTKGYDTKEKITIANDYLLPKIREQVNFKKEDVIIPDATLEYIITNTGLTKSEDGVRNLKRCLEVIHTKLNLFRLVSDNSDNLFTKNIDLKVKFPFTVTKKDVDALIKTEEKLSQSILNSMYV
jgi:ATP-dependent Lon protease